MLTPHLPAEIHSIISSHLAREDLPRYRSVNKLFADIGAQYLFRELTFHASYASLDRIKSVGNHDDLRHYVQTVAWETGPWGIYGLDFDDWKNWVRNLRRRELAALRETWLARLLDHDSVENRMQHFLWEQFERYNKLAVEEHDVRIHHVKNITDLLAPFPKLRTIILEKKQYESQHASVDDLSLQGAELVKRGMPPEQHLTPKSYKDIFPLVAALNAAQSSTYQMEARNLNFEAFSQAEYTEHLKHICVSHITHLHLRFSVTNTNSDFFWSHLGLMRCRHTLQQGYMRDFLRKFVSLQALSLNFESRSLTSGRAPVKLQDIISTEPGQSWPHLRDLAIFHADTAAPTFTHLLSAHASSLRKLALGNICLDPPASWEALLADIQPQLSLEQATFEYFLFDARIRNFVRGRSAMLGWYCDSEECVEECSELGPKLEAYMVKGGVCPLMEQRKVARVVGRLEDGRMDDWVMGRRVSAMT